MKQRISDFRSSTEFFKTVEALMPCLKYRPEDNEKYELIYYGDIEPRDNWTYLRLWLNSNNQYKYLATINGEEGRLKVIEKSKTVAQIIKLFSRDIKKIKSLYNKQRLNRIKEDF